MTFFRRLKKFLPLLSPPPFLLEEPRIETETKRSNFRKIRGSSYLLQTTPGDLQAANHLTLPFPPFSLQFSSHLTTIWLGSPLPLPPPSYLFCITSLNIIYPHSEFFMFLLLIVTFRNRNQPQGQFIQLTGDVKCNCFVNIILKNAFPE